MANLYSLLEVFYPKNIPVRDVQETYKRLAKGISGYPQVILTDAVQMFNRFYFDYSVLKYDRSNDDDMALYQYGTKEAELEVDFTRQLTVDEEEDMHIQHHWTLTYPLPTDSLKTFNLWFDPRKMTRADYIQRIYESKAYELLKNEKALTSKFWVDLID